MSARPRFAGSSRPAPRGLLVIGDVLLDRDLEGRVERLAPDAPVPVVEGLTDHARPGGAGLAAVLAAADGHDVTLVCALADDAAGRELAGLVAAAGVRVVDLGAAGPTPEKVRVRAHGRTLLRLDRGERDGRVGALSAEARAALAAAPAILVSDYGRGVAALPGLRAVLAERVGEVPVVWDPHPRGPEPVAGVGLVTPNRAEAARLVPRPGHDRELAEALRGRWRADGVCLTLGADGALLVTAEGVAVVPAPAVHEGDPCGAGDRFASRLAALLGAGLAPVQAVSGAVRAASAFVAAGGAAAWSSPAAGEEDSVRALEVVVPPPDDADEIVRRVRISGGTVVATGGCFDLLHAGHVATLEAARALGDCLVVCLNSDASVRRLKGEERPLVPEADRAAVLRALACVDAVAVFAEDTPEATLERLRPDVFAKGGDYTVADLPETPLMERLGGRAVILPFVEGRSTTRLIQEAVIRGAA